MVDSDSDQESTPVRNKPQDFVANYSDEEGSLCHIDEHLNLNQHSVQLYTPEGYLELPGRYAETYEVVSIPNDKRDKKFYEGEEPVVKSKPRRVTCAQPDTTTSSDTDHEVDPRLRNTRPITDSTDSSNSGYRGDVDSEFEMSGVDQHRKLVDDSDRYCCKTIMPIISHRTFCNAITRWQHHRPISLPTIVIPQCGVRIVNCLLHCRGLDCDFYERNATFTAVVKFSQNSIACSRSRVCIVEFDVKVYEGRVDSATITDETSILGAAKGRRKLSEQEREARLMHIAVHKVVKLDTVVYHETCPNINLITFRITASVQTVRNDDIQECDSGCIGASRSSGAETQQ